MTDDVVEPTDELIGQVLAGRYRIVSLLGTGAMGAVYIGEHLRMGRRDAIKVLRTGVARDPETIARFTRGARNVSAVRHPNVCTIYDFGDTDDGLQFLAMEYIEGETLKDMLDREGRLELHRAADITRQIAAGLQAAHDVGIVHRDLKPGNIMVTRRSDGGDAVKVVDFDIAKGPAEIEGEEVTRMGFVVGTPEYMSPEQLMGERVDGRSDVYSLGIVLFRMLTGALPFRATSTQEVMVQRLTVDPLRLDEVLPDVGFPPALEDELRRSLARQSAERHASAAAFSAAISAAIGVAADAGAHWIASGHVADQTPPTRITPVASRLPGSAGTGGGGSSSGSAGGGTGRPDSRGPAFARRPVVAAGVAVMAVIVIGTAMLLLPDGTADAELPNDRNGTQDVTGQHDGDVFVGPATDTALDPPPAGGGSPDTGGTGTDADTEPTRPPRDPVRPRLPGTIAVVLDRQFEALNESPGAATLRAIRDTAGIAWTTATVRSDSVTAALIMAQAALMAGDEAECARWARLGAALDPSPGFDALLQACR